MSEIETPTETTDNTPPSNGAASPSTVKPWIAAGFKSRAEWRASKKAVKGGMSTVGSPDSDGDTKKAADKKSVKQKVKTVKAKAEAAQKVKKPSKKPKVKVQTKTKAKAKESEELRNYPRTAAERRKSAERTAHFFKVAGKREEPNLDEKRILERVRVGKETTISDMSEFFAGNKAKRKSMVRNALRWLRATKRFKRLDAGTYRRVK
jgi:hypothetical protein